MLEVKADALEASFDAFEDDGVAALKEELDQLKAKISAGVIAAQRPALDGVKSAASTSFVDGYLRRGIESGLEMKALGSSSDAIGGYAVPEEIDAVIDRTLTAISPIRAIANVVKVGSAGYRKLVTTGGTPSGWVGFEAARPETNTPSFTEIVPANGELYANPAASQQMLDDAMFDVENWLANEIATEFARAEGMAFVKGNGVNQPPRAAVGEARSDDAASSHRPPGCCAGFDRARGSGMVAGRRSDRRGARDTVGPFAGLGLGPQHIGGWWEPFAGARPGGGADNACRARPAGPRLWEARRADATGCCLPGRQLLAADPHRSDQRNRGLDSPIGLGRGCHRDCAESCRRSRRYRAGPSGPLARKPR